MDSRHGHGRARSGAVGVLAALLLVGCQGSDSQDTASSDGQDSTSTSPVWSVLSGDAMCAAVASIDMAGYLGIEIVGTESSQDSSSEYRDCTFQGLGENSVTISAWPASGAHYDSAAEVADAFAVSSDCPGGSEELDREESGWHVFGALCGLDATPIYDVALFAVSDHDVLRVEVNREVSLGSYSADQAAEIMSAVLEAEPR